MHLSLSLSLSSNLSNQMSRLSSGSYCAIVIFGFGLNDLNHLRTILVGWPAVTALHAVAPRIGKRLANTIFADLQANLLIKFFDFFIFLRF